MKKPVPVVVRWRSGGVFRRFGSYRDLGRWLFGRAGIDMQRRIALFGRLRLPATMVRRAADAYATWLCGCRRGKSSQGQG